MACCTPFNKNWLVRHPPHVWTKSSGYDHCSYSWSGFALSLLRQAAPQYFDEDEWQSCWDLHYNMIMFFLMNKVLFDTFQNKKTAKWLCSFKHIFEDFRRIVGESWFPPDSMPNSHFLEPTLWWCSAEVAKSRYMLLGQTNISEVWGDGMGQSGDFFFRFLRDSYVKGCARTYDDYVYIWIYDVYIWYIYIWHVLCIFIYLYIHIWRLSVMYIHISKMATRKNLTSNGR